MKSGNQAKITQVCVRISYGDPSRSRQSRTDLDDVSDPGPGLLEVAQVLEPQLVPRHEAEVAVVLGHVEVGRDLLVEADVPAHLNVVLGLALLQLLVVVRF